MQDLTGGSVNRHLIKTTSFMLVMMVFQTLYFLIDLYWVGKLGTDAVAAVGIAGNLTFINLALTQMLGVGTTTVVSHAAGSKDHDLACMHFNQSQVLSSVVGVLFLIVGLAARVPYSNSLSADAATAAIAADYLLWYIPAMALQFPIVTMGSALRAVGHFKPMMIVSTSTVILNMILAPVLIFGWITGHAFGVTGAAISTFVAVTVGVIWMSTYFLPRDSYLRFMVADWKPQLAKWKRMLMIGLPSGFEFALMTVYLVIVYTVARPFGSAAQAGFGVAGRVIQAGFMPVVALGMSVAPVAGQNFGARQADRVRETFRHAAVMASMVMAILMGICYFIPEQLIRVFRDDPAVVNVGAEYLRIISFNLIASGVIFVASSMFQAMGNTIPTLITSTVRIVLVAVPTLILARMPGFQLNWIWYISVISVYAQLGVSLYLLRREYGRRLNFAAPVIAPPTVPEPAVPA